MKKFWNKVKSARTWKRVTCMVLTLVMVFSLVPQQADAWEKGTSDGVYKVWEWYRADMFNSLPTGQGFTRMLLVWKGADGNTYSTKDCKFEWNPFKGTSTWGHTDTWCTITGSVSDSVLMDADLKTFITETDMGTLKADLNLYSGQNGVEKGRACVQISIGGKEIRCDHETDSFNNSDCEWDEPGYAGYNVSQYGMKYNYGNSSSNSSGSTCYIVHPGYDNGDNDAFWAYNQYICCDGKTPYGQESSGTKFAVYFGRQANYSVLDGTTVLTNNVYKVDSHTFLSGTITVEPGAVLSIEGKCFLNGNIKNYGTLIIQNGGMLCPYAPPDKTAVSGTVYNYGSQATYKSVTNNKTANNQPGEGIMIIMPNGVFAQTQDYGDLYFEKSAMLENHGTMILARSLVAKKAQVSNLSTGKVVFGKQPYVTWIPSLDTLGSNALNHTSNSSGAYYYLTQDEDSYFGNAGTWNTSNSLSGEQKLTQTVAEVDSQRYTYVSSRMLMFRINNSQNDNYFPVAYGSWRYDEDSLREAVKRAEAKAAIYDKMVSYGLVDEQLKSEADARYTYLKTHLDNYDRDYQAEREAAQTAAKSLYPYSVAYNTKLSAMDLQQNEIEYMRARYKETNLKEKEDYIESIKLEAENRVENITNSLNQSKKNLESTPIFNYRYESYNDEYQHWQAEYDNYYYGEYQRIMLAYSQYEKGDSTAFDDMYANEVYRVELAARSMYPDVKEGSSDAELKEKQLASDLANCRAYLTSNYKTVTEYRLEMLDNAAKRLTTLKKEANDVGSYTAEALDRIINYNKAYVFGMIKEKINIGDRKNCELITYACFGYDSAWDGQTEQTIDLYDSAARKNTAEIWAGLDGAAVRGYFLKSLEDYEVNTYAPMIEATKDASRLKKMYQSFLDELVSNAAARWPEIDAQEVFDSLYTSEMPEGEAAIAEARAAYVDEQKENYKNDIAKLRSEEVVNGEIDKLEKEIEPLTAEYDEYQKKYEAAVSDYKKARKESDDAFIAARDIYGKYCFGSLNRYGDGERYATMIEISFGGWNRDKAAEEFKKYWNIMKQQETAMGEASFVMNELDSKLQPIKEQLTTKKNELIKLEAEMTQESFVAMLETDASVVYYVPTVEELQAKVETLRAEYITLRKTAFQSRLLFARFRNRGTIDVEQATKAANAQIEKEAMKLYPDYKEGYTFPTQTPKELASSAGSFISLIEKYTKSK